jgi:hypothetical protein
MNECMNVYMIDGNSGALAAFWKTYRKCMCKKRLFQNNPGEKGLKVTADVQIVPNHDRSYQHPGIFALINITL